jgi:hypothetical protein
MHYHMARAVLANGKTYTVAQGLFLITWRRIV